MFIFYLLSFYYIFSYFFLCQPPSDSLLLLMPRLQRAATIQDIHKLTTWALLQSS